MLEQTVGFIGAGQMARALAQGFVRAHLLAPQQIAVADPVTAASDEFARLVPGAVIHSGNSAVASTSNVVFLAVKPQQAKFAMQDLRAEHFLF